MPTLRDLGLDATDLTGGFQVWREAVLPASAGPDSYLKEARYLGTFA